MEIARRIEKIHGQGREATSEKRPHQFDGFSGASFGGRGSFGRGHFIRPIQLTLQVSHGASGSRGSYGSHPEQLTYSASSAPVSAPAIQSYQGSYSGLQGKFQG